MIRSFDEIIDRALTLKKETTIAICAADDGTMVHTAQEVTKLGLCSVIMVGDEAKIVELFEGKIPESVRILNEPNRVDSCKTAVRLVADGEADVFVKGNVNTKDFLRAVLDKEIGLRTGKALNVLSAYEIPNQEKLLFISDGGMAIAPSLEEKAEIIWNCVPSLHRLGIQEPKVAFLAANEQVSPKMQATVDAAELVKMAEEGKFPKGIYEGPIALDVIMRKEAAEIKHIHSKISGDTDLIVVPNIETGNTLGKAIGYFAGGTMAGIVVGARKPVIMASRAAKLKTKVTSIAWAILAAE